MADCSLQKSETCYSGSTERSGVGYVVAIIFVMLAAAVIVFISFILPKLKGIELIKEEKYQTAIVNTISTDLRMREAPTTTAQIICEIPKGTIVTLLEEGDGWWYVEYEGQQGWCSAEYLTLQ